MIIDKNKISKKEFEAISKHYNKIEYFYQNDDENNKIILIMEIDKNNKKQPTQSNTNNVANLTPEFFRNLLNDVLDERFGKNNCFILDEIKRLDKKIDDGFKRVDERLDKVEQRLDKVEQRLDKVEQRLDVIEVRLDKVEQRLDKVEQRLDVIEVRLDSVEKDIKMLKSFHEDDIEKYKKNKK
ncbi:coiled-coil domain-containing protein [Mycoplasmopsis hyopharyngis]|uniref:coiled-coil domain-containing protein n=1 Tax=Mycoplasmopsis hyopharyngis TaxID=29558 RepID=UPI003873461C